MVDYKFDSQGEGINFLKGHGFTVKEGDIFPYTLPNGYPAKDSRGIVRPMDIVYPPEDLKPLAMGHIWEGELVFYNPDIPGMRVFHDNLRRHLAIDSRITASGIEHLVGEGSARILGFTIAQGAIDKIKGRQYYILDVENKNIRNRYPNFHGYFDVNENPALTINRDGSMVQHPFNVDSLSAALREAKLYLAFANLVFPPFERLPKGRRGSIQIGWGELYLEKLTQQEHQSGLR